MRRGVVIKRVGKLMLVAEELLKVNDVKPCGAIYARSDDNGLYLTDDDWLLVYNQWASHPFYDLVVIGFMCFTRMPGPIQLRLF